MPRSVCALGTRSAADEAGLAGSNSTLALELNSGRSTQVAPMESRAAIPASPKTRFVTNKHAAKQCGAFVSPAEPLRQELINCLRVSLHAKLGNEKADKASIDRWTKQNLARLFVRSSSGKTAVGSCAAPNESMLSNAEPPNPEAVPVERDGFEPSVPDEISHRFEARRSTAEGCAAVRLYPDPGARYECSGPFRGGRANRCYRRFLGSPVSLYPS
jgi:hypothetical protein